MKNAFPGKNIEGEIKPDYRQYKALIKFMGTIYGSVCDIGNKNMKCDYIGEVYNCPIDQVTCHDFNYPAFPYKKYMTVLCFETIEHVQNPLAFMDAVKRVTDPHGTIYISTPGRFRFMWSSRHFFEMTPSHFEKWICSPLGLTIVDHKRIPVKPDFGWGDIGLRPLLRLPFKLFNYTNVYRIKVSL